MTSLFLAACLFASDPAAEPADATVNTLRWESMRKDGRGWALFDMGRLNCCNQPGVCIGYWWWDVYPETGRFGYYTDEWPPYRRHKPPVPPPPLKLPLEAP